MLQLTKISLFIVVVLIAACTKPESPAEESTAGDKDLWLVPPEKVLYKDLPKDRIQSIDQPVFIPLDESDVKPDDLVLVAHIDGQTRIYPVSILDIHEIVNDNINNDYFAITYCPLTASGMLWNREIDGELSEFGVSGMLYNENLMPYDRNTGSIWSQMKTKCVHGSLMGNIPETKALLETKFSTIKAAFPGAFVLVHEACDSTSCGRDLLKNDPVEGETVDLPLDQQYFGFAKNESLLLFNLELFGDGTQVFTTNFQGTSLLVCGNKDLHFFIAFLRNNSAAGDVFSALQNEFPLIMKDNRGNKYDIFGKVAEGPDKDARLETATTYLARTFAWELFYNKIEVFEE